MWETIPKIVFWLAVIYLCIGVLAALWLKNTPYAENPLWLMILLWPFFFFGR